MVILYILFYLFALAAEQLKGNDKKYVLMVVCVVMTLLAGMRDYTWPDTIVYVMSFEDYTKPLYEWSQID